MVMELLKSAFKKEGFSFSIFKAGHLKEAKREIQCLFKEGLIDKDIYDAYLSDFRYDYENVLEKTKSVIIVAAPQNKSIVRFNYRGKKIETILPPQYSYPGIDDKIYEVLNDVLVKNNYEYQYSRMPLKVLAAMSGLCKFGRNNLCYLPEAGSFLRLRGYLTDFDTDTDNWTGLEIMSSCKTCSLCIDACPTKAIDKAKYLINAHKCMTHFNEMESAIPEWIQPQWHNAIVGCMACQSACPHNKKLLDLVDFDEEIGEAETEMILDKKPFEALPSETKAKLVKLGFLDYEKVLSRNLKLLLNN